MRGDEITPRGKGGFGAAPCDAPGPCPARRTSPVTDIDPLILQAPHVGRYLSPNHSNLLHDLTSYSTRDNQTHRYSLFA